MLNLQFVLLWLARGKNQVHDIIAHFFIHMNLVHQLARVQDFVEGNDGVDLCLRGRERHAIKDLPLLGKRRVVEQHLEHEPVHLRFRQRIRPLLVNRVFGRQYQER